MLKFDNYFALFLLLIIPLIAILYETKIISRLSMPLLFSDWQGRRYDFKSKKTLAFRCISFFFIICGIIFAIIALANPKKTNYEKRYISRGSEIIFVLDISPSMAALDANGNKRINEAKRAITEVINTMNGSSFGLIEVGTDASCTIPPSMNQKYFLQKLSQVKLGTLGDGTALGVGISSAIFHLTSSMAPHKFIVLITDGENNAGTIHPFTSAKLAKEQNIPIYVLGIGTKGPVSIEYKDPITGKTYSGFLESNSDFTSLEKIASISKGKFYEIINLQEMTSVINSIVQNEVVIPHFYTVSVDKDYYQLFLFLCTICLFIAYFIEHLYLKAVF